MRVILFIAAALGAELRIHTPRDGDLLTTRVVTMHFDLFDAVRDAIMPVPSTSCCTRLERPAREGGDAAEVFHEACAAIADKSDLIHFLLPAETHSGPLKLTVAIDGWASSVEFTYDRDDAVAGRRRLGVSDLLNFKASGCVSDVLGYEEHGPGPACKSVTRGEFFDAIYREGFWRLAGAREGAPGPASGPGSAPRSAARAIDALEDLLAPAARRGFGVGAMLDLACGDMTWMPYVAGIDRVRYVGADVSPLIVERARARFGADPEAAMEFRVLDAAEQALPRGFDLIFCRHMMMHLDREANLRVLRHVETSGARYLMATTSVRLDGNMDEYSLALAHRVNLLRPPYCLKDPLRLYRDDDDVPDAYLGLWRLDDGEPLVRPRGDDGECDWAELGR